MARGRSSGTGYAVGMIVGFGWALIATILAIVFYTKNESFKTDAQTAENELAEYVDSSVTSDPLVTQLLPEPQPVTKALLDQLEQLKLMIRSGTDDFSVEVLQETFANQASQLGLTSKTYTAALQEMQQKLTESQENLATAQGNIGTAAGEAQVLADQIAASKAEAERLTAEVNQIRATRDQMVAEVGAGVGGQIEALNASHQAEVARMTEELTTSQIALRQANTTVEQLTERLNIVAPGGGNLTEPLFATVEIDGAIADYYDDNAVTINIGADQRVLPGMTFEIYEPGENVTIDDNGLVRSKGRLEVISVNDNNAVCRLVELEVAEAVNVGDVVVNLVYDKNAILTFLVYGDFDLEGDGRSTQTDKRRVRGMIERWGAVVADDLDTSESVVLNSPAGRTSYSPPIVEPGLDYIVVGSEPLLPTEIPDPATATPDEVRVYLDAFKRLQEYQDVIVQAKQLGVPVLNQNRFLRLVGFYRR